MHAKWTDKKIALWKIFQWSNSSLQLTNLFEVSIRYPHLIIKTVAGRGVGRGGKMVQEITLKMQYQPDRYEEYTIDNIQCFQYTGWGWWGDWDRSHGGTWSILPKLIHLEEQKIAESKTMVHMISWERSRSAYQLLRLVNNDLPPRDSLSTYLQLHTIPNDKLPHRCPFKSTWVKMGNCGKASCLITQHNELGMNWACNLWLEIVHLSQQSTTLHQVMSDQG